MSKRALAAPIPGPIAIIDVETTGLFPSRHDRVVEIAAVVIGRSGAIEREFISLVNPARDIGPSSIHGLTSEDILNAPKFDEIAALLLETLSGVIAIAGHNVRFDQQFLESEFSRIGCPLPECFTICTMQLAGGGSMTQCCNDYGIELEGHAHHALVDAHATARLLTSLLSDHSHIGKTLSTLMPIHWPAVPRGLSRPITRDESRHLQARPPTFLQRLLDRAQNSADSIATDGALMAYGALLDRALEDRYVDDSEGTALLETATRWGLSGDQVRTAHRAYLYRLALAAVADGLVTDTERRDLMLVARLLGHDKNDLNAALDDAATKVAELEIRPSRFKGSESDLAGVRVCFTGEMQCIHQGQTISRECAEELASNAGLNVVDSVTKKLDLLVVADPQTQSGKAAKARRYGIRIMHEPVFWKALGVDLG